MRKQLIAIGLVLSVVLAPGASATGWLVNFWIGGGPVIQMGPNIFGGQGDTVDIGLFNYQCSDEDDVVDVGVLNREGDANCGFTTQDCAAQSDPGNDPFLDPIILAILAALGITTATTPHDPHCSDDGDTVDVGLLNEEGGGRDPAGQDDCPPQQNSTPPGGVFWPRGGDQEDGVDVGLLNLECHDEDDANDVGVINCEIYDTDDGIDVGVINDEQRDDSGDTFDLSLINSETNDPVDRNGFNVLQNLGLQINCIRVPIVITPGGIQIPRVWPPPI